MAHRLTQADVEPALPILRAGGGWQAAAAAVNAGRPGAPPASVRTIRRVLAASGLPDGKFPAAPRENLGGRPRKPGLTPDEFKLAIAAIDRHPGRPYVGLQEAAREVSQGRVRRAGVSAPLEVKRHSVSPSWLDPELRRLGWTPAPSTSSAQLVMA